MSAMFRTVPLRNRAASALLVFDDLFERSVALLALVATDAATADGCHRCGWRSCSHCLPAVARIAVNRQAALLLEYQGTTAEQAQPTAASASTLEQYVVNEATAPIASSRTRIARPQPAQGAAS